MLPFIGNMLLALLGLNLKCLIVANTFLTCLLIFCRLAAILAFSLSLFIVVKIDKALVIAL